MNVVTAQTITVNGCASFTTSGGTNANLVITCNPSVSQPGAPTCSSLAVSPSSDQPSPPTTVTLTANCSAVSPNSIASYTFKANGVSIGTQASNQMTITPPPIGTTSYTVQATDSASQSSNLAYGTYTVGTGGGGGSIDLSACTAAGWNGRPIDIPYPASIASNRVWTGTGPSKNVSMGTLFGSNDMIVVRFVASASESSPGSSIQLNAAYQFNSPARLATLATAPCVVATSSVPGGAVLASSIGGQAPVFYMSLSSGFGTLKLNPGQTYYVNYVNRAKYGALPTSSPSTCGASDCQAYIDFLN
jgi:hypothetical protein